jgi:hypothetical protein
MTTLQAIEDSINDKKWRNYYRFINRELFTIIYEIKNNRMHFQVLMKAKYQHVKFHRLDILRYHCGNFVNDYLMDLWSNLDSLDIYAENWNSKRVQKLQDLVDSYCNMTEDGVRRNRQQARICDRIGKEVCFMVAFIEATEQAFDTLKKNIPLKSHFF